MLFDSRSFFRYGIEKSHLYGKLNLFANISFVLMHLIFSLEWRNDNNEVRVHSFMIFWQFSFQWQGCFKLYLIRYSPLFHVNRWVCQIQWLESIQQEFENAPGHRWLERGLGTLLQVRGQRHDASESREIVAEISQATQLRRSRPRLGVSFF